MKRIVIGLDLSLTHSGYAVLNEGGTVLGSGVIRSKPSGDSHRDEIRRIIKIVEEILQKIDDLCPDVDPNLVVIEGPAFMARNTSALVQLSGLSYLLRAILNELNWPFMIVAPTTLKKFITGSGKGDKDMMMMHVFKNYGFESLDNNECDGFSLAVCGLATLGKPLKKNTKPQEEVIKLLEKQL